MLNLTVRFGGVETNKEISLYETLTSLVEDALLRNIQVIMVKTSDRFALVSPDARNCWRVSGPVAEIAKVAEGWRFFASWVTECRCGNGYPYNNAVYPGTKEFVPFFLKKILEGEPATV